MGHVWPEALSMTLGVDIKLRTLVALRAQVEELRGPAAELDATFGTGDVARATQALASARRVVGELAAATAGLRAQVIAADGAQLGRTVESAAELVLRAVTIVIGAQFRALATAIEFDSLLEAGRTRGWFTGWFRSIGDVALFVHPRLERVNEIWLRHRREAALLGPAPAALRELRDDAAREAQQAVATIGDEPSIAHLLREGMAAADWPAVRSACTEIVGALRIAGDLVTSPSRLHRCRRGRLTEPAATANEGERVR